MFWNKTQRSKNVDDQRKDKEARGVSGKFLAAGLLSSIAVATAGYWLSLAASVDPVKAIAEKMAHDSQIASYIGDDPHRSFVESILGSTEEIWTELLAETDVKYQPPTLVLYNQKISSACGSLHSEEVGPAYCPDDQKIYIDLLSLEKETTVSSNVSDFAQAYVIAHEVAHHVQNSLGLSERIEEAKSNGERRIGESGLSVRRELQADCLTGVWANHAQKKFDWLEPGDIDEALALAVALGNDVGNVSPNEYTHGTSQQRVKWFNTGFTHSKGDCRTFDGAQL